MQKQKKHKHNRDNKIGSWRPNKENKNKEKVIKVLGEVIAVQKKAETKKRMTKRKKGEPESKLLLMKKRKSPEL